MVDLKPIHTEADYKHALKTLATLWNAPEGTLESDQLDILATLIEKYEEQKFPIDLPDPIVAKTPA